MPLGHDPSIYLQGALEAQRESRRNTANILEQLGKQVREDIQRIQTTRDLRAFGEELSQINPQSREFPLQALGAAMRHPLAFEDKRGQAAINLLGGAHRNWQMQQRQTGGAPFQQVSGMPGVVFDKTQGTYTGSTMKTPSQSGVEERNRQKILTDLKRQRTKSIDDAYKLDAKAGELERKGDPGAKMARENAARKAAEVSQLDSEIQGFHSSMPSQVDVENLVFDVNEVVPGAGVQPSAPAELAPVPPAVFQSTPQRQPGIMERAVGEIRETLTPKQATPRRLIWNPETQNFD